jgi:hypothetical protein
MSDLLSSDIRRVAPADAWTAWEPDKRNPWNARWAAHLFRRAAFGASPKRLDRAVRDGVGPTIDVLLKGEPGHEKNAAMLDDLGQRFATKGDIDKVRGWWLYVMLNGGHPLREKLALFWHNHFATSVVKVISPTLMFRQNQLLRKHALGEFPAFIREMGRDGAMLLWLDSNQNVKGKANENYARELMELFTLGVGNYTEKDVQEAARAFTGWHIDDDQAAFAFNADEHDDGMKTVLGQTGKWGGDDVVRILLSRPACARFIVGKLYRELISEAAPPPALVAPLEKRFRESGYKIGDLVGTMLRSRLFFSEHAFQQRVKGPVEFVLGMVQSAWAGPIGTAALVAPIHKMGQELFAPPNVKGWPGGRDWLNTTTLLARNNFADHVAFGGEHRILDEMDDERRFLRKKGFKGIKEGKDFKEGPEEEPLAELEKEYAPKDPPAAFDVARGIEKIEPTRRTDIADSLLTTFLPGASSPRTRAAIIDYLDAPTLKGERLRERAREAAHAILCSAEYQLC